MQGGKKIRHHRQNVRDYLLKRKVLSEALPQQLRKLQGYRILPASYAKVLNWKMGFNSRRNTSVTPSSRRSPHGKGELSVVPLKTRAIKKRPPFPKAALRFAYVNLFTRCCGRSRRRGWRGRCAIATGRRKLVQPELVADAGVGRIADRPLQVGGVLNGQQPFV